MHGRHSSYPICQSFIEISLSAKCRDPRISQTRPVSRGVATLLPFLGKRYFWGSGQQIVINMKRKAVIFIQCS